MFQTAFVHTTKLHNKSTQTVFTLFLVVIRTTFLSWIMFTSSSILVNDVMLNAGGGHYSLFITKYTRQSYSATTIKVGVSLQQWQLRQQISEEAGADAKQYFQFAWLRLGLKNVKSECIVIVCWCSGSTLILSFDCLEATDSMLYLLSLCRYLATFTGSRPAFCCLLASSTALKCWSNERLAAGACIGV